MSHHNALHRLLTGQLPPLGTRGSWQGLRGSSWGLALFAWTILRRHRRPCILAAGAALALLSQILLLCVAFYLVDLTIALMELWAELARKHLEITL